MDVKMKLFILALLMSVGLSFGAQAHPMKCDYDHKDMKCEASCGKVVHDWRHHHHHKMHHHHHHMMHHHHHN